MSHIGTDGTSGDYVAYVRTSVGWILFDDTNITEVSEADVLRQQAYILFYQQKDNSAVQVISAH